MTCSTAGGVIYEVVEDSSGEKKLEKVLGLKGHRRHATCTDWSNSTDCGPCVTAGFDGQIRISTLLSQWIIICAHKFCTTMLAIRRLLLLLT